MNKKTTSIIGAIVIAAVCFSGGYVYGSSKTNQARRADGFAGGSFAQFGTGTARMRGGSALAGGFVGGTVIAKDGNSITVALQNGGSRIAFVGTSTAVSKSVAGNLADISAGENVVITGSQNPDGSLTAQMVQIRPANATSTRRQ